MPGGAISQTTNFERVRHQQQLCDQRVNYIGSDDYLGPLPPSYSGQSASLLTSLLPSSLPSLFAMMPEHFAAYFSSLTPQKRLICSVVKLMIHRIRSR